MLIKTYNRATGIGSTIITKSQYNSCNIADQLANAYERQNGQVDVATKHLFNNDVAAGFDWFQMHHDDGMMDGYLDIAENENGDWMTTETIKGFTEVLPSQAVTFEESGMDGLVSSYTQIEDADPLAGGTSDEAVGFKKLNPFPLPAWKDVD